MADKKIPKFETTSTGPQAIPGAEALVRAMQSQYEQGGQAAPDFIPEEEFPAIEDIKRPALQGYQPEVEATAEGMAAVGWGQIGNALGRAVANDGAYDSTFDPNVPEAGITHPVISPEEVLAGVAGARIAKAATPAIMRAGRAVADEMAPIVGNEIGSIGRDINKAARLPSGHTSVVVESAPESQRHRILDSEGLIAGFGPTPEAALEDFKRVTLRRGTQNSTARSQSVEDNLREMGWSHRVNPKTQISEQHEIYNVIGDLVGKGATREEAYAASQVMPEGGKLEKITSVRPNRKLGPNASETMQKVQDKNLTFFDPESFEQSFIAKDANGEPIGHLGLDENMHTKSIKVLPEAQGQGVATTLYEKAVAKNGVIRSDHRRNQLEGGVATWKKLQDKYPDQIRQARHPETLKELDYKVWQKDTNPELRAKEAALEEQIDALREKYGSASENLILSPKAVKLRDKYTVMHDKLMEADHAFVELSRKHGIHTNESSRGRTGIPEIDQAAAEYGRLLQAKSDLHKQFTEAANSSVNPKEDMSKAIDKLIKQHKELTNKSGHTVFAAGGLVVDAHNEHEHAEGYAEGGEVPHYSEGTNNVAAPDFIPMEQAATMPEFADMSAAPDFIPASDFVSDQQQNQQLQATYGTGEQQLKAGLEGVGQGLLGPLSTLAETKLLGVDPAAILGREKANPITHTAGQMAGFAAPALLGGGLGKLTQMGAVEGATKLLGLEAGNTLASRVGMGAAKVAVENALIQSGDEVSKMILEDPDQTVQTALTHVGLASVIGGVLGGSMGAASHLWDAKSARGSGQFIQDFKARIAEHVENPDPVKAVENELAEYYKGMTSIADEVYGPSGLKAQDIRKALPETNNSMLLHVSEVGQKLSKTIDKMAADTYTYPPRLIKMLQADAENFANKVSSESATAADLFEATQELKQTMQGYAKYEKRVAPFAEEHGFVKEAKSLAHDLRTGLEDTAVWGQAAKRQQAVNKAFSEYLPSLKDFEKKFTTQVADDRVIDPGKIQTYINQLPKASGKIKKGMLGDFLEASDKFKKVIDESHANLGFESPILDSALNVTRRTLDEKTLGEKVADYLIDKGLAQGAGTAMGAAAGASVAHVAGIHKGLGALIGSYTVGPFLSSVLPGIAKTLVGAAGTAKGLKASTDVAMAAYEGDRLMTKAIKNMFKAGVDILPGKTSQSRELLPSYAQVTDRKREELKRSVAAINANPSLLTDNIEGHLSQFTPGVAQAAAQTSANALTYLATLRPQTDPQSPLDASPTPSKDAVANYNNALDIAQQPLLILQKMQKGTITTKDMMHITTMYPSLVKGLQAKLQSELVNTITKHGKGAIPYKTRMGLSVFLGQPIDSTMKAASIQAAQIVPGYAKQQAEGGPKSGGVKSSPTLQKTANKYMTPEQARLHHAQSK